MYKVIKTFGNERGYSCCFRQYKAIHSHCCLLHGYSLGFEFEIVAKDLDEKNWVYDFGDFTYIKQQLSKYFDHTLALDKNDPYFDFIKKLDEQNIAHVHVFEDGVGCEKFAKFVFDFSKKVINSEKQNRYLKSVKVFEHGSNASVYSPYETLKG